MNDVKMKWTYTKYLPIKPGMAMQVDITPLTQKLKESIHSELVLVYTGQSKWSFSKLKTVVAVSVEFSNIDMMFSWEKTVLFRCWFMFNTKVLSRKTLGSHFLTINHTYVDYRVASSFI